MYYKIVFCIIFLLVGSELCFGADQVVSTSMDDIRMDVRTLKPAYLVNEPIIIFVSLQNTLNKPQDFAELNQAYGTLSAQVIPITKETQLPKRAMHDGPGTPDDYKFSFGPGVKKTTTIELLGSFSSPLPPGNYCVVISYVTPSSVPGIWQGKLETPPLMFSVASPEADDAKASVMFGQAYRNMKSSKKRLVAAQLFARLKDPEIGGVFAKYAGYYEAFALTTSKDQSVLISKLTEYVDKYSDTPHYGQLALRALAYTYMIKGDDEKARIFFERLPEGYERESCIKKCDTRLDKK